MRVAETIIPIVLVMLLGYALHKRSFLQSSFLAGLNQFVYWLALPALIVRSLLTDEWVWAGVAPILTGLICSSLVTYLMAWFVARKLRLKAGVMASFLQGGFRGNLALIGLPLLIFLDASGDSNLTIVGILVLSPAILMYNITSVLLFARLTTTEDRQSISWLATLLSLRTNPLILATVFGFILSFSVGSIHPIFARFLDLIGNTATPLALVCIGATMATVSLSRDLWLPILVSGLKIMVLPVVALIFGLLTGMAPQHMFILLLYAACPTAAASAILARQMGGDEKLASCIVALSTAFSLIPLTLIVAYYG
ncbi:MAG: AEC family transporter [Verrucomicrobia bacterium]|nr:AEC family transporter [Verrucomicrobiota bacterium]